MADVKPIRTEADYEAAIEALEGLWVPRVVHRGATGLTCLRH